MFEQTNDASGFVVRTASRKTNVLEVGRLQWDFGCWLRKPWHPVWTHGHYCGAKLSGSTSFATSIPPNHSTAPHIRLETSTKKPAKELDRFHSTTQGSNAQNTHKTTQHSHKFLCYQRSAQQLWSHPSKKHTCTDTQMNKQPSDNQLQGGISALDKVVLAGIKLQRGPSSNWLAVMLKPFWRHSKRLSALTALIGSLMKSPTMYLTGTKGGHPICTHQMHLRVQY